MEDTLKIACLSVLAVATTALLLWFILVFAPSMLGLNRHKR